MAYLGMNLALCHIIISKIGALIVETDVSSIGNNQLLENLEESVIVLEENSRNLVFANKTGFTALSNAEEKNFALIDSQLFKKVEINQIEAVKRI